MSDNVDLMIKLFDTLKQASDKHESSILSLIQQQDKLVGHIEYLPIKDLQDALKEHNKESKDNIDSCTETVEIKSDNILERVKGIENKIGKMILVVLVTFTLFTSAILIARLTYNKTSKSSYPVLVEELQKEQDKNTELQKEIDRVTKHSHPR